LPGDLPPAPAPVEISARIVLNERPRPGSPAYGGSHTDRRMRGDKTLCWASEGLPKSAVSRCGDWCRGIRSSSRGYIAGGGQTIRILRETLRGPHTPQLGGRDGAARQPGAWQASAGPPDIVGRCLLLRRGMQRISCLPSILSLGPTDQNIATPKRSDRRAILPVFERSVALRTRTCPSDTRLDSSSLPSGHCRAPTIDCRRQGSQPLLWKYFPHFPVWATASLISRIAHFPPFSGHAVRSLISLGPPQLSTHR
jgi:hypothetical protein